LFGSTDVRKVQPQLDRKEALLMFKPHEIAGRRFYRLTPMNCFGVIR